MTALSCVATLILYLALVHVSYYHHRYIYYDGAELCGDNVLHVMYAAKKYLIDGLVDGCKEFLDQEMSTSNVCTILSHCVLYDEQELIDKCMELVNDHPEEVLQSDDFLDISSEGLYKLVSSDVLNYVAAVDVYKACITWAKIMQERQTDVGLRNILGGNLYYVQFSQMSATELSDIIDEDPGILSPEEQVIFLQYIAESTDKRFAALVSLGFDVRKTTKQYVTRNRFLAHHSGYYGSQSPNCICFCVDKTVTFVGITMYGTTASSKDLNVNLQLFNDDTSECLSETREYKSYTGTSEPVQVTADEPVTLSSGVKYRVVLCTNSPSQKIIYWYGTCGQSCICEDTAGVTFTFTNGVGSAYTNTKQGQIPQIIFAC